MTAIALCCVGCGTDVRISLTADGITLNVGESRDIKPYIVFEPAVGADRTVSVTSDSDAVGVSGTVVTARHTGSATVTVKAKSSFAKLTVSVRETEATRLAIVGELVQTAANGTPSAFSLRAETDSTAAEQTLWSSNGEEIGRGESIEFTPAGYGEYAVTASLGIHSASVTLGVYRHTEVVVSAVGELEQTEGNFSPVRFTAVELLDSFNPASVFEWFVNGEPKKCGMYFEFVPPAEGEYDVSLKVNGDKKPIGPSDRIRITAVGPRAPKGYLDPDGEPTVRWSDGKNAVRVSVISPDGKRRNYEMSDAQHAYRFGAGYFDADGLINVCSDTPGEYRIIVSAEGSSEFTFMQYESGVQRYIDEKVFCKNSFISSAEDAVDWVREVYLTGKHYAACYISRTAGDVAPHITAAAQRLGLTADITVQGYELDLQLERYTNEPSRFESLDESFIPSLSRYTVLPHIEYNTARLRGNSYVLPIERKYDYADVDSSEQLLYAALGGYRPVPKADSAAQTVFAAAKSILLSIIGEDYGDEQKVHAIYDWLQWTCVTATDNGADSCGRFLEGVFGSPTVEGAGRLTRCAVTAEGAAKAFAFMCAMEGIEASAEYDSVFYNSVTLDGIRYVVDVLGGKLVTSSGTRRSELCTHTGLFLPISAGSDESRAYSLKKYTYNECYFDYYIDRRELDDVKMLKAAVEYALSVSQTGAVRVPSVPAVNATYTVTRAGAEFIICDMTEKERSTLCDRLINAAKTYCQRVYNMGQEEPAIDITIYGNNLHLTVALPQQTQNETSGEE